MSITLEEIAAEYAKIGKMIDEYKSGITSSFIISKTEIQLNYGEHYSGIILGKDDEPNYHLILLPGETGNVTWEEAYKWAGESGGLLPTRGELALLYANLKEQFKEQWYWSRDQPASGSDYAWIQVFSVGWQDFTRKLSENRARAVRRIYDPSFDNFRARDCLGEF